MIEIVTDRLILTPLTYDRLHDVFELDSDMEVMKYLKKPAKTIADSEEKIKRYIEQGQTPEGLGSFTVLRKSDRAFMGLGFLVHIELNTANPIEVGYRLKKIHWGQGFATEIATALIQFAKNTVGLKEIYGTTDPENFDSQKVLMKVGLKPTGDSTFHGGTKIFKLEL